MKSDHRHELKTNELAEWLRNLPEWTKENLVTIIIVVVVVAVLVGDARHRVFHLVGDDRVGLRPRDLLPAWIHVLPLGGVRSLHGVADALVTGIQLVGGCSLTAGGASVDGVVGVAFDFNDVPRHGCDDEATAARAVGADGGGFLPNLVVLVLGACQIRVSLGGDFGEQICDSEGRNGGCSR